MPVVYNGKMAKCNSCHKSTNSKLRKIYCRYCQAYYHIKCTCLRDLQKKLLALFKLLNFDDSSDLSIFEMFNGTVNYDIDILSLLTFNPSFKNFKTTCFQDLDPDTKFYDEIACNYIWQTNSMTR